MKDLERLLMEPACARLCACAGLFVGFNEMISPCSRISCGKCLRTRAACVMPFTYSICCVCFFKVNDGRWANVMSGKDYGELVERERENRLEGVSRREQKYLLQQLCSLTYKNTP